MEVHDDQYPPGDEAFEAPPASPTPGPVAATPEAVAPAPPIERPRNPDGTFAASTPTAPPAPTHPPLLARLAASLGFTPEEIATTSTVDLERDAGQRYAYKEQLEREGKGRYREPATAAAPAAPEPPPDPLRGLDFGADAEGKPRSANDYDTGLMGVIRQLAERVGHLEGHVQTQARLTVAQRIDKVLGEDAEFFGTGGIGELDPESAEALRRHAAYTILEADKSNLPLEAKVRKARAVLRGTSTPKPATAPPAEAPPQAPAATAVNGDRWRAGAVARPTQREGAPEPKGVAAAKKAFLNGLKEHGLDNPGEYDGEFPG